MTRRTTEKRTLVQTRVPATAAVLLAVYKKETQVTDEKKIEVRE